MTYPALYHRRMAALMPVLLFAVFVSGQTVALRNNLLYDAALSPNLGADFRLDSAWTVGANVGANLWDWDKAANKKWRHVMLSPHFRHYTDSMFHHFFWGGHLVYSHYNVGGVKFPFGMYKDVRDGRRQGDLIALGGSVGYEWPLSRRLHLEAELGVAVGYTWYKSYDCPHCGTYRGDDGKFLVLPKLGFNLVVAIGPRRTPEPAAGVADATSEIAECHLLFAIHDVAVRVDEQHPDTAVAVINEASDLLRTDCGDCHRRALTLLDGVRDDERAQNALGIALYLCGRREEAVAVFRHAAAVGNADAAANLDAIERARQNRE